ncbi:MAG: PEP-CTERM sorting domain-containing protein [Planctomycetia bacterium]|jgi:hypothetical protein
MKQLLLVRIAALIAVVFLTTGLALADTPTLTHLWSFDGDLTDSVGTLTGAGTDVTTTGTGVSGNAAYFNGSTSKIMLEDITVLPTSGAWTVSFWEYADSADANPDGYYFSDAAMNPLANLYVRRYIEDGYGSAPNGKIAERNFGKYNPSVLATDTWINHTITVTDDGATYWYIDGQLDTFIYPGSMSWEGLNTSTTNPEGLVIGNRTTGSRTYWGYLDEFQIYSGSVDGGMVNYLYANPGSTLDTYDAVTFPDPGLPDIMPGPDNVLHWTFDTDLSEAYGTAGATGTAIGDATIQAGAGVAGGALYLDGNDDAVVIDGDLVTTGSVSFSFWAKTDGTTNGYMLADGDNYSNLFIRRDTNDTSMITGGVGTEANIENIGPNPEDTWQHVVVVSSQETGEVYCYVDGELAQVSEYARTEVEAKGVLVGILSDLYVGNRTDLGRDFKGWIDDLQIYDGTLTGEEVAFLYNNPGVEVPEPSTIILLLGAVVGWFIIRRR